jgi:hypothetical protein
MATRQEKIEAVNARFLPIIETKRLAVEDARVNLQNKQVNYEEKLIEYNNKMAEVNTYYDAQDKIRELQALTEPTV